MADAGPVGRRRLIASAGLLVLGLPPAALTAVLPELTALRLRLALVLCGILAVLVGMLLHQPRRRRPWLLLAVGMGSSALGDVVVLTVSSSQTGVGNHPADAWLTTLAGLLILAGMVDATRAVRGADHGASLDAVVLALAVGTLIWHLGVVPAAVPGWLGSGTEVAGALQVLLLVGVFGLLLRTVQVIPRGGRTAAVLLAAGLVAALAAFLLGAVREASDALVQYAGARAALGAAANLAAGAAALHPSMRMLTQRREPPPDVVTPSRTAALALALLVPPAMLLGSVTHGIPTSPMTLAGAWAALVPAVLVRLHLLARSRDAAWRHASSTERRLMSLVAHTGDVLLVTRTDGDGEERIAYASPASVRQLGVQPHELTGRSLTGLVVDEDRPTLRELVTATWLPRTADLRARRQDGTPQWLEVVVDVLPDEQEPGLVVTLRDVTERKHTEIRWAQAAIKDPLTGLLNRRGVETRIETELRRLGTEGRYLGVVLADLDDFKAVNDRWGHVSGDQVLCRVAERLRSAVRRVDAVGRIGGDEFVVVCPDLAGHQDLERIAERVALTVGAPVVIDGVPVSVGISIGIAMADGPDDTLSRLLRRSDVALYLAKAGGSGRVVWSGASLTDMVDLTQTR
jgi:diguanylate cyclase (GGDEF)-like protein/PAS domain S-box-containing protein